MPVTRAFVVEFAREWGAAWNARDVERVLALLDPDVVWIESGVRRVARGLAGARGRIEADLQAMTDARGTVLGCFLDEASEAAAVHWRIAGQFAERPVSFETVSLWTFRGERLARLQVIYDVQGVIAQAGVEDAAAPHGVKRLTARAREALRR